MTGILSSSWVSGITWDCDSFTKIEFNFTDFFFFFLRLQNVLRCFFYYDKFLFWLELIFYNIGFATRLDFQIYIFLYFWFIFNNFFWLYIIAFNKIFHFFKCLFHQNLLFINERNRDSQTSILELVTIYTFYIAHDLQVYLHDLRSNDKNDLLPKECPTTSKSVYFPGIFIWWKCKRVV